MPNSLLSGCTFNMYDTTIDFKGDIIITDPCYLMRSENDYVLNEAGLKKLEFPVAADYFSVKSYGDCYCVPDEKDYPDYQDNPSCTPHPSKEEQLLWEARLLGIQHELSKSAYITLKTLHLPKFSPTYRSEEYDYRVATNKYYETPDDDWRYSEYGAHMEKLGFTHCAVADTLCGDWNCNLINFVSKDVYGSFCADAGLVGVFLLDEVKKYNPDFAKKHNESCWCVLNSFNGNIVISRNSECNGSHVQLLVNGTYTGPDGKNIEISLRSILAETDE